MRLLLVLSFFYWSACEHLASESDADKDLLRPLKTLRDGQAKDEYSLQQLQVLSPPVRAVVIDPHINAPVNYRGFLATDLLTKLFGPEWLKAAKLVYHCADGYKAVLTPEDYAKGKAWLVYDRLDAPEFTIDNPGQNKKNVPLGPFYQVWQGESRTSAWPYQVVAIELVSAAPTLDKAAPMAKASPAVLRGYQEFKERCSNCHSLNGSGGQMGPELNYPVNVTEYFNRDWLPRFIKSPRSIRASSAMPAFDYLGDQKIKDIIAYLRHMQQRKIP